MMIYINYERNNQQPKNLFSFANNESRSGNKAKIANNNQPGRTEDLQK
jgi:hypothetical protein